MLLLLLLLLCLAAAGCRRGLTTPELAGLHSLANYRGTIGRTFENRKC